MKKNLLVYIIHSLDEVTILDTYLFGNVEFYFVIVQLSPSSLRGWLLAMEAISRIKGPIAIGAIVLGQLKRKKDR
jgi:hypothetical protein